jgi:hypothetical protein
MHNGSAAFRCAAQRCGDGDVARDVLGSFHPLRGIARRMPYDDTHGMTTCTQRTYDC